MIGAARPPRPSPNRKEAAVMETERVATVLEAAADYIGIHGWCQNDLWLGQRVCLLGAIYKATREYSLRAAAETFVRHHLGLDPTQEGTLRCVASWNDEPGREVWEVDELLRTTAKRVRHGDLSVA